MPVLQGLQSLGCRHYANKRIKRRVEEVRAKRRELLSQERSSGAASEAGTEASPAAQSGDKVPRRRRAPVDHSQPPVRVLVLHPLTERHPLPLGPDYRLAEAVGLAEACGWAVLDARKLPMHSSHPATFFGPGKVAELRALIREKNANAVFVDAFLTPAQQGKLGREWSADPAKPETAVRVLDRFAVILEIFSLRAQTKESKMQVELAWTDYQRSFLVGKHSVEYQGEHQRGGRGFLAGAGESQLELDRRRLADRAAQLRKQLQSIAHTHELHLAHRRKLESLPVIAVVGYTNVGKSLLVNRLTGADLRSHDELFTSLSPYHRVAVLPSLNTKVVFLDTVGFISNLPLALFAAFKATLDEIRTAQVLVHVRDVAHYEADFQRQNVQKVLAELKVSPALLAGQIEAWNKIDLLEPGQLQARLAAAPPAGPKVVPVSALQGVGLPQLVKAIEEQVVAATGLEAYDVRVDSMDVPQVQYLYKEARVLKQALLADGAVTSLRVTFSPAALAAYKARHQPRRMTKVPASRLVKLHRAAPPVSEEEEEGRRVSE